MKCAGIISEFNPFHTGHRHLIDSIREKTAPDAVVCVMSGDFVQRGMPAMWDKYIRAASAVDGGADLVLELPAVYAVSGAGQFARGGVKVLKGLGCIEYMGFGSESGDGEQLMNAASLLAKEPENFSRALKEELASGKAYPSAYSSAAASIGLDPVLFSGANDILALEYLKQNVLLEAD
ncbi:MAG: nucleotidyltransferase family protein, partial [Firmicutes bacterium]|nr:nucleotidyltransferase family protein [Bacillota bacterium]